jgi:uncharacterized protein
MTMMLVNESTSGTVASRVELALDRASRRRGLLGRTWMSPTSAFVLSPCWMIHTAFMKFHIDVVFADGHGRVVQVVRNLRPWRVAMCARASVVIELPAGMAAQRDINVGDRVTLLATSGADRTEPVPQGRLPLEIRVC